MIKQNGWKALGAAAGIVLGMKYLFPVLLPFFIGWLLAEAVNPLAEGMAQTKAGRKLRLSRSGIGAAVILLLTTAVIAGSIWGLQAFAEKLGDCIQHYPEIKVEVMKVIRQCCDGVEQIAGIPAKESAGYVYQQLSAAGKYLIQEGNRMDTAVASVKWCALLVGAGIIGVVSAILFLQERNEIKRFFEKQRFLKRIKRLLAGLGKNARGYFKAQAKIIGIVSLVCIAGLWTIGIEHSIGYGLLVGILDALPVLGTGTFLVPAGILFLLQGKLWTGVGLFGLYLVTAGIRQLLEPRLIGQQMGVSPLLVLLSVYLGVFLYGGWGFLLGPLSALLFFGVLKEWEWLP